VTWLQDHLGAYRFYSLGPIQPNYGSYFGIAQLDTNDLPRPKSYDTEIASRLDPNAPSGSFTGTATLSTTGPTPAQELTEHLSSYEQVGVRYVIEPAGGTDIQGHPFPATGSPPWPAGPRRVYRDSFAEIWQLPDAAPAFSVTPAGPGRGAVTTTGSGGGSACTVVGSGWDVATVMCSRPAVLTRQVQYVPGWTATVDGRGVPVEHAAAGPPGLFQQVRVPSGTSTVRFTFVPPHTGPASAAALVAALAIVGSLALEVRRRRRAGGYPATVVDGVPTRDPAGRPVAPDPSSSSGGASPPTSGTSPRSSPPTSFSQISSSSGGRRGHHGSRRPRFGL
jgi:hypothetical protein